MLKLSQMDTWKQRFRAPGVAWLKLAAQNPQRALVCANPDGPYQLYAWHIDSGQLTRLTDDPNGVKLGAIAADGESVMFLLGEQGPNIGHYFRVGVDGTSAADLTPEMPAYTSFHVTESDSGAYMGFMAVDQHGFQIMVMDKTAGGTPHIRYESQHATVGPFLSQNGEITVVATAERSGGLDFALEAYDTITGQKMADLWDGPQTSIEPIAFSPAAGDYRLLACSNTSGSDRPLIWNPQTGDRRDLALVSLPGDLEPWGWSPDGARVLLCQTNRAQQQVYTYHLQTGELKRLDHPPGVFTDGMFTAEGHIFAIWEDAGHPPQIIELDGQRGQLRRTVLVVGDSPGGRSWRSVDFESVGGATVQGWLMTPDGDGPFATVIHLHGGPTDVHTASYHAAAQAWVDHGVAFFSINYHGSITFGQDFAESINGRPGQLEVQDIVAGARWLIDQKIAREDSLMLAGASYGGYLVLQALGKAPDLWAGGMATAAIADWTQLYAGQDDTLRAYQVGLFGGTPDETPDTHRDSSPITYVGQVRAPLLIIHEREDTRHPPDQIEAYIKALESHGQSPDVHWIEESRAPVEQQIANQEIMLRFAFKVLSAL